MTSRSSSSPSSPNPMKRSRKSCARKCERACCSVLTYFPLAFVYGLTTWAVWVVAGMGVGTGGSRWKSTFSSAIAVILYVLLNWSYTTAVFTDPGSPLTSSGTAGYSHLPTQELPYHNAPSFTVKSTGETRFCKKCQARKPDRSHHCSTCRRCVLKMDHHCPWLATCVGLRNYKAFLLFLIYTSVYCWICFVVTTTWLWSEVFSESQYTESLMPINYVLLCVISGIIGLVLTGFTIWHASLAYRGQTTIECLEKTRYLSPLRKTMRKQHFGPRNGAAGQSYGQQLAEIHANALPGVTRPEEGEAMLGVGDIEEARPSRSERPHRRNYDDMERSRERDRYEDYLDEQDSEKLPSAFDLGWRRNLRHLFGDRLFLRFMPICNTTGDGWNWEPNPKWVEAREVIRREREREWQEHDGRGGDYGDGNHHHECYVAQKWPSDDSSERHYLSISNAPGTAPTPGSRSPGKFDINWSSEGRYEPNYDDGSPSSRMSMKTLRRRESFSDSSGDEDDDDDGEDP